jgi:hypothetical protein
MHNMLYRDSCMHNTTKTRLISLLMCHRKTQTSIRHISIHIGMIPVQSIYDKNLIKVFVKYIEIHKYCQVSNSPK